MLYNFSFVAACIVATSQAISYPPIEVLVNGSATTLYVQYPSWSEAATAGSLLTFDYNNRMYLSTQPTLDTSKYFMPNLLGGSLEFDVDVSQSGCGCLTTLYGVLMPSAENPSDPFQYCDGMDRGYMCPEFDMMEANKYAFRSVAHKCVSSDGSFSSCDRNGTCGTDVLTDKPSGVYGPGSSTIDTNQVYHVKQDFLEDSGAFTGYVTTLSQDGRETVLSSTNCGSYLGNMSADMTQMVIAISNWGSKSLDWLQHGVCSGQCSRSSTFSQLKNLSFTTTDTAPRTPEPTPEPTPMPMPTPGTYKWGNDCNLTNGDCALVFDCQKCSWSWPADDPKKWSSTDAKCRCQIGSNAPPTPEPTHELTQTREDDDDIVYSAPSNKPKRNTQKQADLKMDEDNYPTL